jgi:hypothetical protein
MLAGGCSRQRPAAPQSAGQKDADRGASIPVRPPRPEPEGRPARTARCGHAVAFAGWRPDESGVRDVLLVCDPGDNWVAEVGHAWAGKPREIPVHPGRQRPSLVLDSAETFTVTGAVIAVPQGRETERPRMAATAAAAMPDLSQDFSPLWPGLCAPTSAADVLFSIGSRKARILTGFDRGPGEAADTGAARLIAGGDKRIGPDSLAGRMGIGQNGIGVTNEGMRRGFASWLDAVDPGAWQVRLDWFDDAVGERDRADQRMFFGRLAAAVEAGGGAIVCLWPGTEFTDAPVGTPPEPTEENADVKLPKPPAGSADAGPREPALPEADFPDLPPPAAGPAGLPGRSEPFNPAATAAKADARLDSARRKLERGDPQAAFEQAAEAVSFLHQAARVDPALKERLAEAIELCRTCESRLPSRGRLNPDKTTEFQ